MQVNKLYLVKVMRKFVTLLLHLKMMCQKAPFYRVFLGTNSFKSHLPHVERKQSRLKDLLFFRSICRGVPLNTECFAFRGSRSPRHKCLVGRFDGEKVHRTFSLIRLTHLPQEIRVPQTALRDVIWLSFRFYFVSA